MKKIRLENRNGRLRLLSPWFTVLLLGTWLSAADPPAAPARIEVNLDKVEGTISPTMYGQFDEFMYGGVKGGLHAELLRDRSFDESPNAAGLPRYWERDPDDRNDDAIHFRWDDSTFYPPRQASEVPNHSLQIEVGADDGQRRGIYQADLRLRAGLAYDGYVWIKSADFKGRVSVALEENTVFGSEYALANISGVGSEWRQYKFRLTSNKTDRLAKLALLFYGKGRLWVDQVSLMPGDAIDGVRRDVFEKIRALRPAFIRWPGGNVAQDYHWQWGVGPRDQRTTWINLSWGNELEPSDFGTDEFIQLCRNLGAEPSITVNVEGRGATVQEAAAWVEYANGAANTKYGAMRAANGHPEPFRVRYWEIGNEIWCHTLRDQSSRQSLSGLEFAGGDLIEPNPYGRATSANITPDPSGISYYNEAFFLKVIHSGKVGARKLNPVMPWWFFGHMSDEDLRAIFSYLRTVKPVHHRVDNTEPIAYCRICNHMHHGGALN